MRRLTQAEILDLLDRVAARAEAWEAFRAKHSYEAIARDLGIHPKTVSRWVREHGGLAEIRSDE